MLSTVLLIEKKISPYLLYYYYRGFKEIIVGNLGLKYIFLSVPKLVHVLFDLIDPHPLPFKVSLFSEK